jgi:hypothetical protein
VDHWYDSRGNRLDDALKRLHFTEEAYDFEDPQQANDIDVDISSQSIRLIGFVLRIDIIDHPYKTHLLQQEKCARTRESCPVSVAAIGVLMGNKVGPMSKQMSIDQEISEMETTCASTRIASRMDMPTTMTSKMFQLLCL